MTTSPGDELRDHLALALIPGLGPRLTAALLERFGSAAAARQASAEQLQQIPHIGPKLARQFAEVLRQIEPAVARECELLRQYGVQAVLRGQAGYPAPLLTITNPPPLLFLKGSWIAADRRAVAVVGTRQASAAGLRRAEQLARGLALAGYTVVSGLARGVDGAAHRGALAAGGRTLAVLAGGLSRIYPPEHEDLARQIAPDHGCLISETPLQMPPQPGMFPARNRLISGLSLAVVLVEAGERSGALITAQHALEQGREVFACPGDVDSYTSAGCLHLLRQGARLIRNVQDLLEDLHALPAPAIPGTADLFDPLPPPAAPSAPLSSSPSDKPQPTDDRHHPPPPPVPPQLLPLWERLGQPRHIDDLARDLGRPVAELLPQLMQLELLHKIRRLPGNFYEQI